MCKFRFLTFIIWRKEICNIESSFFKLSSKVIKLICPFVLFPGFSLESILVNLPDNIHNLPKLKILREKKSKLILPLLQNLTLIKGFSFFPWQKIRTKIVMHFTPLCKKFLISKIIEGPVFKSFWNVMRIESWSVHHIKILYVNYHFKVLRKIFIIYLMNQLAVFFFHRDPIEIFSCITDFLSFCDLITMFLYKSGEHTILFLRWYLNVFFW